MVGIGIMGRRKDPHVEALVEALPRAGGRPVVVDFHAFPRLNLATLGPTSVMDDIQIPEPLDLDGLDLIHLRTTCFADLDPTGALPDEAREVSRYYRRQVAKVAFQLSLAERLALRKPVLNRPAAFRYHRQKGYQHTLLLRHRIPTPRALVTADASGARRFVEELEGRAVVKPQASGAEVVMADDAFFASRTRGGSLGRPYIFQQYVKGRALRAYALGGRLVSMGEIHYDKGYVDWRERTRRVTPYEPDDTLREQIRAATRLLDLAYCGIDIEHDASTNRFYFLDFNPSALFVGWSRLAGIDMAQRIAEYLIAVAQRGGNAWLDAEPPMEEHL